MDFLELLSELFGRLQKKARSIPTSPVVTASPSPPSVRSYEASPTRKIDFSKPPLEAEVRQTYIEPMLDKQMHPAADDNKPLRYVSPAVAARMKQK